MNGRMPASYVQAADRVTTTRACWMHLALSYADAELTRVSYLAYQDALRFARSEEDRANPRAYLRSLVRREEAAWERYLFGPYATDGACA